MPKSPLSRREVIENCIVKGLLTGGVLSQVQTASLWAQSMDAAKKPTPAEVLGPFYRKGAPDAKNLRIAGDPGFPLEVSGQVWNSKGQVVADAKVDLWHADHHGIYDAQGYRFRTRLTLDAKGQYTVATVMPGHYPDRPAQHIHYLITAPGHKPLITQAYFATDPYFEGDPDKNYKKGNIAESRELVLPVRLYEGPGAAHAAIRFDIVLEKA